MTKLNVVFNFDRTLTSIEGPIELAKKMKVKGVAELTERAMSGEESFSEVFKKRFTLFRPSFADLRWLADQYLAHQTPDAKKVVTTLTELGHHVYIVSASYRIAILPLAAHLGIPALNVCAVDVNFNTSGQFESYDAGNILTTNEGLEIVLAEIAKRDSTVYIGDSVRDLDSMKVVDLMIGYGGAKHHDEVQTQAHHYIAQSSLLPVLAYVREFSKQPQKKQRALALM